MISPSSIQGTIMKRQKKIIRAVTVAMSTEFFDSMIPDLQKKGFEIVTVSSDGPELEHIRLLGAKTIVVDMYRRMSPIMDFASLVKLIRVFAKEKPLIVHSMTPKAGLLCMLASWITRVPLRIHTFTGLIWPTATGLKRRILMATDWLTCACATHIIPEGQGVKNDLQSHITKKPMKVLGYGNVRGVDMERFSKRKEILESAIQIKDNNVFTFLFVGRIVGDKGINELVEAFLRLNREHPNTRLVLTGNYERELDPIKRDTQEIIDCHDAISTTGPKTGDNLVVQYAISDCFVFPSYREGFPNTVLEAGAMGLPCIVTDINGSREIIENGNNGLVIPPRDAESLYFAMKNIYENSSLRETIAGNARPMIESRFDKEFVKRCQLEFYNMILEN